MGHVNNAVFLSYLEVARTAYFKDVFGVPRFNDVDFILARAEIDFKAPVLVGDALEVSIRASAVGTKSFRFAYEVKRVGDGVVVATAETVQAMFDYERHRTKPLSDEQRARILAHETPGSVVGG